MTQKSLAENIYDVGELMADNLVTMGVTDADADDGLTTLAGKILDIPPTPVGVKIDTWTDFSSSASSVSVYQSFTVSGLVGAYHDDEVIDFIGYLKGATVKIYNGNVLLGSTTTDNNGEFTYTVTPTVTGTMSLKAEFETIDDYAGSVSSVVSVEVISFTGIDLTSNKSILSYVDGDTCTLSAQLVDSSDNPVAIEGVTVTFKKGTTSLGTANTNSSGIATLTYTSAGVGDISLTAEVGMIVSETYSIQDGLYGNTLTVNSNHFSLSGGNASISYSSDGMTIKGTSTTNTFYMLDSNILPSEFVVECDVKGFLLGYANMSGELCVAHTTFLNGNNENLMLYTFNNSYSSPTYTLYSYKTPPFHLKVVVENGTASYYVDNVLLGSRSHNNIDLGFKLYNNRGITIKNLVIKPL